MNLGLAGKVALVGGSSRGIGKAIARSFLAEGASVVITGRGAEALALAHTELSSEFGADRLLAFEGDLTGAGPVSSVLALTTERFGTIDCLVANIGNALTEETGWNIPPESWDADMASNFWSGVLLVQKTLPSMIEAGRGSIVFTNSIAGLEGHPAAIPYNVAKAALATYAKNLSVRLGPGGIRVNSVAPGNVIFPGGYWQGEMDADPDAMQAMLERDAPVRRFGKPEEIGDLVAFISSERCGFMTGAMVVADGGQTRRI
jgi:3-oxoacyl-[acyl-carrier protein] reductase